MKRLWLYLTGALLLVVLLCLCAVYWLLQTAAGARFALTTLTGAAGIQLSAQEVRGRLLDRLQLSGVRATTGKERAQLGELVLSWEPRQLLSGNLLVHELSLKDVRVQDDTPPSGKALQFPWPRVSAALSRFRGRVERLEVRGLSYRRLQEAPVAVDRLTAALAFENGILNLSGLSLDTPDLKARGDLSLGLWHPSLRADLAALPAKPLQGMDLFSLQARLTEGKSPEQVAGPVALAGKSGGRQRLELTGELGMTESSFDLRRFTLLMPGRRGKVSGEARMTLTAKDPLFALSLKLKDVDLAAELKRPTRINGSATFSGSVAAFLGTFDLANSGPGWENAALAAHFKGGEQGVQLSQMAGRLLDGRVSGALDIAWNDGVRVKGALSGRGINPASLAAGWPGALNLDVAGNLAVPKQGAYSGSLRGKFLVSRLRGQPFSGDLAGAFAGKTLRIDRLLLVGRGFDLRGSGELDRRLDLSARVSDLSRLLPDAGGQVDLAGWVRWRDGQLAGSAHGTGANLAVAGVRAAALQLDANLGAGKNYPVQLTAQASTVQVGQYQVQSAQLALNGTVEEHRLQADLTAKGGEAHAILNGGYRGGVWRGELTRFSGRDSVGPWALAAPAALTASAAGIRVAPLTINGLPGERLELAGDFSRQPATGSLRGAWSGLNLSRANVWLTGATVVGSSSGELSLRLLPGERLLVSGRIEGSGTFEENGHRVSVQQLLADLHGDQHGMRAVADLRLAGGQGDAHLEFASAAPASLALPKEGELTLQMTDFDLALLRPVTPSNFTAQGRVSGLFKGRLLSGGRVDLRGNSSLANGQLQWHSQEEQFDGTIDTAQVDFSWRGRLQGGEAAAKGILQLHARAAATGSYSGKGQRIALSQLTLQLDADQQGTRARVEASLDKGGVLRASLTSSAPAGPSIPETGDFAFEAGGIDPALLRPFLPSGLNIEGEIAADGRGKLLPGQHLEMTGELVFSQGRANWQGPSGEMKANVRSATLAFDWHGEKLSANLSLALAEYGQAQGRFLLPIPARLPVAADPDGSLQGTLSGRVQERGVLTSFLPGIVQETHGDLAMDLTAGGVWRSPRVEGTLALSNAGAYLPAAGITVSNVQFQAKLKDNLIRIDSFSAVSGGGRLQGDLLVQLQGWRLAGYSGHLSGDNFQTMYLPELQMSTSPRLTFQGDGGTVTVRGEVQVPQMLVAGPPVRPTVAPSSDVILEGAQGPAAKQYALQINGLVHVVLGGKGKVQVKASGINATLGGEMDLELKGLENITSSGEIKVLKGSYQAYGVDLDIVRGRIYYSKAPVTQPTLDILALRTVGDVKAGVVVAGYLRAPVIKLYSEPSMADVDVLAYVVLGHPLSTGTTGTDQAGALAMAASGLLSFGQSESLQDQVKQRLGLSVLGVETVTPSTSGLMGYKQVNVTPTGAPAKAPTTENLMTVGKYVTPKLYVSYGRSLVTQGSLLMLRYDVTKHWQIETQSGTESGADLYYKLEFN